jgi:hypothetical protein
MENQLNSTNKNYSIRVTEYHEICNNDIEKQVCVHLPFYIYFVDIL